LRTIEGVAIYLQILTDLPFKSFSAVGSGGKTLIMVEIKPFLKSFIKAFVYRRGFFVNREKTLTKK